MKKQKKLQKKIKKKAAKKLKKVKKKAKKAPAMLEAGGTVPQKTPAKAKHAGVMKALAAMRRLKLEEKRRERQHLMIHGGGDLGGDMHMHREEASMLQHKNAVSLAAEHAQKALQAAITEVNQHEHEEEAEVRKGEEEVGLLETDVEAEASEREDATPQGGAVALKLLKDSFWQKEEPKVEISSVEPCLGSGQTPCHVSASKEMAKVRAVERVDETGDGDAGTHLVKELENDLVTEGQPDLQGPEDFTIDTDGVQHRDTEADEGNSLMNELKGDLHKREMAKLKKVHKLAPAARTSQQAIDQELFGGTESKRAELKEAEAARARHQSMGDFMERLTKDESPKTEQSPTDPVDMESVADDLNAPVASAEVVDARALSTVGQADTYLLHD
jgi:hypothetical protein